MHRIVGDRRDLFGGSLPWNPSDWTSSDDRVRGGASTSFLDVHDDDKAIGSFLGHLDITTLGGAGFASQRTTTTKSFDLSAYDGLELDVAGGDGKKYTLVLKDEVLPKRDDGREQSTVSWEYDFVAGEEGGRVLVPWSELEPTYRGREKKDAEPLKKDQVMRLSLMMRSFFGEQEGDFQLNVRAIAAIKKEVGASRNKDSRTSTESADEENRAPVPAKQGWISWFMGGCARL